jgi:tetratricopeptide (TPR) repeat protein
MKKVAILLILGILAGAFVFAQDYKGKGRVKGKVLDENNNPIEGVRVKLFSVRAQQGFTVTTDANGVWKAMWIRSGQWNVDYEKVGYEPKKISMHISTQKANPDVDIVLKKAEGLVVSKEIEEILMAGNILFDEEKYDEAIAHFVQMLVDYPDVYILNKNIGNCYFQKEDYDKSIEYYLKVLDNDPENNNTILAIGNSYANKGEDEKALEWYNKVEFEKIDNPTILYNMGINYYKLAKFEDAMRYFKRAIEVKEDFLDGLYYLGLCHVNLQNNEEAIAVFEKYLTLDSDSGQATQVKGFLDYLKK